MTRVEQNLTARDRECALLEHCAAATVCDELEASVAALAIELLRHQFPIHSKKLKAVCDDFLSGKNSRLLNARELVEHRVVASLPRFKDMLTQLYSQRGLK